MTTITVWILVAAMYGTNETAATVIDRFSTEQDCVAAETRLNKQSSNRKSMREVVGVCIEAKVARP